MAKAVVIAKVVLGGVVLLAKKALLVAILSLAMSSIAASKKKASSNATTGDHKNRRFGTVNYFDLNPGYPEHGDKYIDPPSHTKPWPTSHQYHDQTYPNFIHSHEDFYEEGNIENSSREKESQKSSYNNGYKTHWLDTARPHRYPEKSVE
ncbi:hypothetical protein L798_05234 [Zootermopsis nevadensis]|uniref:Uncharacterized protein n=1 Tax=Zootermopsis nevadensis TaxID=136037 RepID=A0A067RHX2_ZOONE|nr:hypothetical protein L798_05234 [Zootermopsis nevadensis]